MSLMIEFSHLVSQSRHSDNGHLTNQPLVRDYSCHSNLLYGTLGSQSKGCRRWIPFQATHRDSPLPSNLLHLVGRGPVSLVTLWVLQMSPAFRVFRISSFFWEGSVWRGGITTQPHLKQNGRDDFKKQQQQYKGMEFPYFCALACH